MKVVGEGRSLEKLVEGLSLKEKVEVKEKKARVEVRSLSLKRRAEELALKKGVEVEFVEEAAAEDHSLKQQRDEQSMISTSTWQRFEKCIARSFQRTFDNAKADFALSLKKKGEELSLKWREQVKAAKKAAEEERSLKQQKKRSFVSTRQKVQERRTRSLQKILDDARDEFPWPDVSDIPAELGPVPRLPYAQSSKTMEVLAVTYCGAALRLANVRFGDVIDSGMQGVRLDYHKTDGRQSLEWFERRKQYRKRRHSLVVEVGDDDRF